MEGASEKYGLQTQQSKGEVDEWVEVYYLLDTDVSLSELEDERERAKRLVRSNNFTQQTNALDVDKHM